MKKQIALLIASAMAATSVLTAGPAELEPKAMAPPTITDNDHWHFNIGMPGWLANVSGTVGLQGVNSEVDLDTEALIRHASFITSLSADARKGRFGFYGDFLYLGMDDTVHPEGIVSKGRLHMDYWVADGEMYYRVLEGPQGWLDLRAGARYTDVYSSLKLDGNSGRIDQAATDLVNAVDGDLRGLLERLFDRVLEGGGSPLPIPPLGTEEKLRVLQFIRDARMDPMTAQARIAARLNRAANRYFSLTERWVDPYIGVRGRYNLTKVFYLTGKVDVGGFGIGSDITTQASAAIGCQVTRRMYAELGYRYLYANYEDDSNQFVWKTDIQGVLITSGIEF